VKSFRERSPWVVGIISLILLTIGVTVAFSVNKFEGLRGVYSLSADLVDAAGLQPGNEVRVAGVKVGRVTDVTLGEDAARVKMEINDDTRIPSETRLEVKLKTLLGQKFIDLQLPESFVAAAAQGDDVTDATEGLLEPGDVIPLEQTKVPFDIYQAATEGTAVLAEIDKKALRGLLDVLASTIGTSKEELRRVLVAVNDAGSVLGKKSAGISKLLKNSDEVTRILADSDQDIDGLLVRSADVLGTLADRRANISSLLAATQDLADNLGTLIQVARGDISLGIRDLDSILILAEGELGTIDRAIKELGVAQELFGQPNIFGRFIEGHICALTTEDTCVPDGSAEIPGLPIQGTQPSPTPAPLSGRVMP
jgi:phospholipid/cholesterol/gamma-HCH transport system substrate-binding protein